MKPNESQVDEFFDKLPQEDKEQADIFDENVKESPKVEEKVEDDPEQVSDSIKNRQHRRLEKRLQQERETNIALAERLKVVSEMDRFSKEVGDEVIPDIAKMFDASDVGKENALRLSKVFVEMQKKATEDAVQRIEQQQLKIAEEQKEYENLIDTELEQLEDRFNVDLTSDAPKARKERREFLELVGSLSPKDEEGNIISYADFGSTFDLYRKTKVEQKEDTTRRDEIAQRSIRRSNSGTETIKQRTPGFSGWKQDYGL